MVEETANNVDAGKTSNFDRYVHASKMQPQSSGSLRSNAGAEKGKEIAAKLNIHRVHGQLRGLDTTGKLQTFCFFVICKCEIFQKRTFSFEHCCNLILSGREKHFFVWCTHGI